MQKKSILILGSGAREAAFAYQFANDGNYHVYVAPGNCLIGTLPNTELVPLTPTIENFQKLVNFAVDKNVSIILPGPEDPLCNGFKDFVRKDKRAREKYIKVIGPTRAAAKLESSKWWAKEFMQRHNIPTAKAKLFTKSDDVRKNTVQEGIEYLKDKATLPVVLKADGLCGGKGVVICESIPKAISEYKQMINGRFNQASASVLIEEFMDGVEVSVFALVSNGRYTLLPEAKDYKRLNNGDEGPNTGGMGAVSPVPFFTHELRRKVEEKIIKPTLNGMFHESEPYCGFLYVGLMVVNGEPFVVEYNCRMGDPETAVVLDRIDGQFVRLIEHAAMGTLQKIKIVPTNTVSVAVVLASEGYPEKPKVDQKITPVRIDLLRMVETGKILPAAIRETDHHNWKTTGGRVCVCVGTGVTFSRAQAFAYNLAGSLEFYGKHCRNDIGNDMHNK